MEIDGVLIKIKFNIKRFYILQNIKMDYIYVLVYDNTNWEDIFIFYQGRIEIFSKTTKMIFF